MLRVWQFISYNRYLCMTSYTYRPQGLGGQPTQVYQPNDAHGTEGRNLHSHAVFAEASRVSRRTPPLPPSAGTVVLSCQGAWATYGAARTFYVATSSNDETSSLPLLPFLLAAFMRRGASFVRRDQRTNWCWVPEHCSRVGSPLASMRGGARTPEWRGARGKRRVLRGQDHPT